MSWSRHSPGLVWRMCLWFHTYSLYTPSIIYINDLAFVSIHGILSCRSGLWVFVLFSPSLCYPYECELDLFRLVSGYLFWFGSVLAVLMNKQCRMTLDLYMNITKMNHKPRPGCHNGNITNVIAPTRKGKESQMQSDLTCRNQSQVKSSKNNPISRSIKYAQ